MITIPKGAWSNAMKHLFHFYSKTTCTCRYYRYLIFGIIDQYIIFSAYVEDTDLFGHTDLELCSIQLKVSFQDYLIIFLNLQIDSEHLPTVLLSVKL